MIEEKLNPILEFSGDSTFGLNAERVKGLVRPPALQGEDSAPFNRLKQTGLRQKGRDVSIPTSRRQAGWQLVDQR